MQTCSTPCGTSSDKILQTDNNVVGRSVAIFPTGLITNLPDDGFHVVLGPEIRSTLDETARENCADSSNMQRCVEAVHKELKGTSLGILTKRFLVTAFTLAIVLETLVEAAIAALAGAAVAAALSDDPVAPERVKFDDTSDEGVLGQLNTVTDVSAIVIATGTDNKVRSLALDLLQ
jgi:hypothetical protein